MTATEQIHALMIAAKLRGDNLGDPHYVMTPPSCRGMPSPIQSVVGLNVPRNLIRRYLREHGRTAGEDDSWPGLWNVCYHGVWLRPVKDTVE